MAQTVLLKRSSVAGNVPGSSDLALGEIAVNTADGAVYIKKGNNDIVAVADNDILHIDTTNSRIGIGTTSPARKLDVNAGSASMVAQFKSTLTSSFVCFANSSSTADQVRLGSNGTALTFSTNYAERMRIDTSGNVGIGTTDPQRKLEVVDNILIDGSSGANLYFRPNTSYSTAGNFGIFTTGLTSGTYESTMTIKGYGSGVNDVMTIKGLGNVGIGTASPASKLSADGTIRAEGFTTITGGGAGTEIRYDSSGGWGGILSYDRGNSAYKELRVEGSIIKFKESGTDVMTIDGNKVGIGTSSPSTALEIVDSTANAVLRLTRNDTVITTGNQIGAIEFAGADTNDAGVSAKIIAEAESAAGQTALAMYTGTPSALSERLRIDKDGLVGIGTDNPDANLHISSATGTELHLQEETAGQAATLKLTNTQNSFVVGSDANPQIFFINTDGNQGAGLCIDTSNNVGIGTTSPSQTFTVEKNSGIFRINTSTSTYPRIEVGSSSGTTAAIINRTTASQNIIFGETSDTGNYFFRGGNVGIGTTAPAAKLHISGNSDVSDGDCQLIIDDVDGSAGSRIPSIQFRSVTGGTTTNQGRIRATDTQGMILSGSSTQGDDLVVQSSMIGIGTPSNTTFDSNITAYHAPTGSSIKSLLKLWVNTSDNSGNRGGAIEWVGSGDKTAIGSKIAATRVEAGGKMDLRFYTGRNSDSNHEKMRILTDGKVGIGTTSPGHPLHISTTNTIPLKLSGTSTSGTGIYIDNDRTGSKLFGILVGNIAGGAFSIKDEDAGATRFVINSSGSITFNQAYTFPTSDGSANQVLKTDGSGNLTFATVSGASGGTSISDADGDTKIQVEESTDEDIIRFDIAGTQKMFLSSTQLGVTGDLAVSGNLNITGDINSTSVTNLDVTDKTITMANNSGSSNAADGAGIIIEGPSNNASLLWDHTNQYLEFSKEVFSPAGFVIGTTGTKVGKMYNSSGVMALEAYTTRQISFGNATNGEHVRIDDTGNVGIGTASPDAKLQISHNGGHTSGNVAIANSSLDLYNPLEANTDEKGSILTFSDNYFGGSSYSRTTRAAIKGGTDTVGNTADGFLAFYTDASGANTMPERMRIDHDGNVGIGTTAPSYMLDIGGGDFFVNGTNRDWGGTAGLGTHIGTGNFDIYNGVPGSGAHKLRVTNAGNLGIGTESPASKLHVSDGGGAGLEINPQTANDRVILFAYDRNTSTYQSMDFDALDYHFNPGGTEKVRIDSSGNVGIGTNAPLHKLAIGGNSTQTLKSTVAITDMTNGASLSLRGQAPTIFFDSTSAGIPTILMDGRGIEFKDGTLDSQGSVDVKIDATGNVGIGTTNPTNHINTGTFFKPDSNGKFLTVNGGANGSFLMLESSTTTDNDQIGGIYFTRTQGQGDAHKQVAGIDVIQAAYGPNDILEGGTLRFFTKGSGSGVNTSRMVINPDGNVGIGTTTPSAKLQVEEYGVDTTTTSTTATTQVAIHSFAAATFRSARFTVQVTNSTDSTYHTSELLLIHDGTTANITEFGEIHTGSAVEATFDCDVNSGNVRLLATPASTDTMAFKVVCHSITT
jgi:hypothetical protein